MSGNKLTCDSIEQYTTDMYNNVNKNVILNIIKDYNPEDYKQLSIMYNTINKIVNKNSKEYLINARIFNYIKLNAFKKALDIKFNEMTKEELNELIGS
jgi:hypothetical protein